MSTSQLTPVEPGNRIQLPADWADAFGLHKVVILDRSAMSLRLRVHRSKLHFMPLP